MAEVLRGPAVGPDGKPVAAGKPVPASWPTWFVEDLRRHNHLTAGPVKTTPASPDGPSVALTARGARKRKAGS